MGGTVAIFAHNDESTIADVISASREHFGSNWLILVVCGGCSDRTVEIASQSADLLLDIPENVGISVKRNLSAKYARGSIVVFLDGHMVPLSPCPSLDRLESGELAAVCGRHMNPYRGVNAARDLKYDVKSPKLWYKSLVRFDESFVQLTFTGGVCAVRKEILDKTMFDVAQHGSEDILWQLTLQNAGHALAFDPNWIAEHRHPVRLFDLLTRGFRATLSHFHVLAKAADAGLDVWPDYYITRYPFLLMSALIFVGLRPLTGLMLLGVYLLQLTPFLFAGKGVVAGIVGALYWGYLDFMIMFLWPSTVFTTFRYNRRCISYKLQGKLIAITVETTPPPKSFSSRLRLLIRLLFRTISSCLPTLYLALRRGGSHASADRRC